MPAATEHTEDLSHKRCFNHALREAAARCPQCRRYFCRECVTEHAGRMTCAPCLRALTRSRRTPRRIALGLLKCAVGLLGLFVAGLFFYYLGQWLLGKTPEFHEGTMWGQ